MSTAAEPTGDGGSKKTATGSQSIRFDKRKNKSAATEIRGEFGETFVLLNTIDGKKTVLGKGTTAKVRLAQHKKTGEIVAVKKLKTTVDRALRLGVSLLKN